MPPIPYPLINGFRYGYSSIEAILNGIPVLLGIRSINYRSELKAAAVRGTAASKIGRTRGVEDHFLEIEMYRLEWEAFKLSLATGGQGFGEKAWDMQVIYSELPSSPVTMDVIKGIRIEEVDSSSADGPDALMVKLTCSVMGILWGGFKISSSPKIGI